MTAQIADKLRPFGIDYVDAMDRFGDNAELYERLALKYLDDGHLVALQAAMEAKDYSEGYSQAHALKGVAGNLSFKDLYECAALVSDALYAGEYEAAAKHLPEVERAHKLVIEGLKIGATARCRRRHTFGLRKPWQ
ncbi:MAG: Hpt domain-containing protein [Adlercreutzia equolifaciens]